MTPERQRAAEAARYQAQLAELEQQRTRLRAVIDRLRKPVDVDALVRLADAGAELTDSEWGALASERSDDFNRLFDARKAA